jgi:DoxX-like family
MVATGQTGVVPYPLPFIRFIAGCELLGAGGIILPVVLHIEPFLAPVAAIGLAIIALEPHTGN